MLPTPDLAHLSCHDYKCVYEPAEDTFLLLDALENDLAELRRIKPCLALEIGSGSGCVITFLSQALRPARLACVATDLNPQATQATLRTAERNLASVDSLLTCLSNGILRNSQIFDVIIFNPPYVPTERVCLATEKPTFENIHSCPPNELLEAAWAGGKDGRHWIDLSLPLIADLLSHRGVFYMIVLQANRPEEIRTKALSAWNLDSKVIAWRRTGLESLGVLKFWRASLL